MDALESASWPRVAAALFWNGLAALVVILSALTLAGFLGKVWWCFELVCHFRAQYVGLLVLLSLALLLGKHRWFALAAASFAVVNLATIVPIYAGRPIPEPSAQTVRALLLNVYKPSEAYDEVLELIEAEKPDIIVLVEMRMRWIDALKEVLEREHRYTRAYGRGVAIYSRFPLTFVAPTEEMPIQIPALVAELQIGPDRLTLVATHPDSPDGKLPSKVRNRQLKDLASLARKLPRPLVLLGDLNVTPFSPYFSDLLRKGRLIDSRQGFGFQPSWPVWMPPLRIPIDHCLVSEGIIVHDRRLGSGAGSDHLSVIVDFSLTPQSDRASPGPK